MEHQDIDLHKAVTALSGALDLVGIDEVRHGKRVAIMAYNIAKHLDWPSDELISILHAGMLHDCGVSQVREHRHLTEGLEWSGSNAHCLRGWEYLSACPPLAYLAEDIRYHHTRWSILQSLPLSSQTKLRTNLLFLADRIDVLQAPFLSSERILSESSRIIEQIQSYAGLLFSPELVAAFSEVGRSQAFWLVMEPEYLDEDLRELGQQLPLSSLNYHDQRELARLFSRVVDAKSRFTEQHSERVALVTRELAMDFGIEGAHLEQLEIAGLLHDLGKLRVSEDILEKPGKLTPEERASMQRHSYDTYRILQRVFSDSDIPKWAGFHHETLRGSGYPFKSCSQVQDLECRIISVADIFQALAQNRPYRGSMPLEEIIQDLQRRASEGDLDHRVVEKLAARAPFYYELAKN